MKYNNNKELSERMQSEWDKRGSENAKFYIQPLGSESEESFNRIAERDKNIILEGLGDNFSDKIVLEIGCGIGRLLKLLSLKFFKVYGVDISSVMIKKAKSYLVRLSNVHVFQTNGTNLSIFNNEYFDIVFAFAIFEHIPASIVYTYIRETYRILKRNGIFRFQVYEKRLSIRAAIGCLLKNKDILLAIHKLGFPVSDNYWNTKGTWPVGKRYTRKELKLELEKAGFTHIVFHIKKLAHAQEYLWVTCKKV